MAAWFCRRLLRGCLALVQVLSAVRGPLATVFIRTMCRPVAWATATNRRISTSVRCVANRSRSIATYASTVTCTAIPSMRATSVVVASAGHLQQESPRDLQQEIGGVLAITGRWLNRYFLVC